MTDIRAKLEEIERLRKALQETTAEAIEHRRNIVEARQANFMGVAHPALKDAYDKEIARFDALIDRARAAHTALPQLIAALRDRDEQIATLKARLDDAEERLRGIAGVNTP